MIEAIFGSLLAFLCILAMALLLAVVIYSAYRLLFRKPEQLQRFLGNSFGVFAAKAAFGLEKYEFVDASRIKKWGQGGILFLFLPAMAFDFEAVFSRSNLSSFGLIGFAAYTFFRAAFGLWALKQLGVSAYTVEQVEQWKTL